MFGSKPYYEVWHYPCELSPSGTNEARPIDRRRRSRKTAERIVAEFAENGWTAWIVEVHRAPRGLP